VPSEQEFLTFGEGMFISHCGLHIPVPEALQILVLQRDLPDSGRNAGTGMERFQCGAHVVRTGGPEGRLKIELSVGERAGIRTQDLLIKSQLLYRLSYALPTPSRRDLRGGELGLPRHRGKPVTLGRA
jgi:hypothetical protein